MISPSQLVERAAIPNQEALGVSPLALRVPGLSQIPQGHYSLRVPLRHGRVQVGFRGTPESFGKLAVDVTADQITISREGGDPLDIDSGIIRTLESGKRVIEATAVLTQPEAVLNLRHTDNQWVAEGAHVASKVGLTRFAAKLCEATIAKDKQLRLNANKVV